MLKFLKNLFKKREEEKPNIEYKGYIIDKSGKLYEVKTMAKDGGIWVGEEVPTKNKQMPSNCWVDNSIFDKIDCSKSSNDGCGGGE